MLEVKCSFCDKTFTAKNKRFKVCSDVCRNGNRKKAWDRNNHAKYNKEQRGKLPCKICNGWYHKPASHAVQRHGVTAIEYKEEFGYDRIKGVMSDQSKETARSRVYDNPEIIQNNLIKGGKDTRFKEGQEGIGVYERREQTVRRLKANVFKKRYETNTNKK